MGAQRERDARVWAPLRAAAERLAAERLRAAPLAWRESAKREAALRGRRFSAFNAALARLAEVRAPVLRLGDERFFGELFDLRFGLSRIGTPARRASESPIAMACFAFFAPCAPSRILSISRWTNSPARWARETRRPACVRRGYSWTSCGSLYFRWPIGTYLRIVGPV